MKSRVTPYSFWAVTSLRTAPLRFHSPYSAISGLSPLEERHALSLEYTIWADPGVFYKENRDRSHLGL
jgi:hypothetical protein